MACRKKEAGHKDSCDTESELKITIDSRKDFDRLVSALGTPIRVLEFRNHFFDTEDFRLYNNRAAFRIREADDGKTSPVLTLKRALSQGGDAPGNEPEGIVVDRVFVHQEFEISVSRPLFEFFSAGPFYAADMRRFLDLTAHAGVYDFLEGIEGFSDGLQFRSIGHFACSRHVFNFSAGADCGCPVLELDNVSFPGEKALFELECEGNAPEAAMPAILELLNNNNVKWRYSHITKFARFMFQCYPDICRQRHEP